MSQTPPKVSRTLRTSHRLKPWRTAGTSRKRPAHDVAIWPIGTNPGSAPYTTWAICPLDVRLIFGLDHGVGHPLLFLYDVNAPNSQNSNEFKALYHYPSASL